jgi:hypothetical protein
MAPPDEIDAYLGALGQRLTGPRRARADLLAEARDALRDAAAALEEDGLPPAAARRRAVADFGAAGELALAYQAELAAGQGRRVALLVALLPAGMLTADLMWWRGPEDASAPPPAAFLVMVEALDWTTYVAGALALLALPLLGRLGDPRRLVRVLGWGAASVCAFVWLVGAFAGAAAAIESPQALAWPPMLLAWAVLHAVLFAGAWAAIRCVAATRRTPAAAVVP